MVTKQPGVRSTGGAILYRQARPHPARTGLIAEHALRDVINLRKTPLLQGRHDLTGSIAGAADQHHLGIGIPVNGCEQVAQKTLTTFRMAHADTDSAFSHTGLAPFFRLPDIDQHDLARLLHSAGIGRCHAGQP